MRSAYVRVSVLFLALLILYLAVAWLALEPLGYYGTRDQPRFQDPWLDRTRTILGEGMLYRDVDTTTPPLTNYLLVPPSLVAIWVGEVNPWMTLAFMLYYALFNLLAAYALLALSEDKARGYRSAVAFLLNPITMGNAVLQRQDESVLAFFFALALLYTLHQRRWRAGIVAGLGLLVKLTAGLVVAVSFLQRFRWEYVVIPVVVFALVMAPFLYKAGQKAIFWDLQRDHTEHPFQYGGISLGWLWVRGHDTGHNALLLIHSILLIIGGAAALGLILYRPLGVFEDLALLLTVILVLSPKCHSGYFVLLALAYAPLLARYKVSWQYYLSGLLVLAVSMCKFPLRYYDLGLGLMAVAEALLLWMVVRIRRRADAPSRTWPWERGRAKA